MSGHLVGAGLLLASAAVIASGAIPTGSGVRRRLAQLGIPQPAGTRSPRAVRPASGPERDSDQPDLGGPPGTRRIRLIRLAAGLGGLTTALIVEGWPGVVVGVLVALGLGPVLRRIEPAGVRRRRLREAADLPLAADLLGAALRAGAPVDGAVMAVAEALGGPLGERLVRVGRTLRLGGEPAEAWGQLSGVAGAERLVAAAVRSAASGAALAGALTRLADDLRADRSTAAEAAARRAGVLIVLPLGLCFLPAFILAGLVPVIVAVLGDVL